MFKGCIIWSEVCQELLLKIEDIDFTRAKLDPLERNIKGRNNNADRNFSNPLPNVHSSEIVEFVVQILQIYIIGRLWSYFVHIN